MHVGQLKERTRLASEPVEGLDVEPMRVDTAFGPNAKVGPEGLGQSQTHIFAQTQRGEVDDGASHHPRRIVPHGLHPLG
jgi:hypothetical protein